MQSGATGRANPSWGVLGIGCCQVTGLSITHPRRRADPAPYRLCSRQWARSRKIARLIRACICYMTS
jgi:hypothetical protein